MIFILQLLIVVLIAHAHPLEPLRAQPMSDVPFPSGMTFCASTGTLFMVSDKLEMDEPLDNSIYELSVKGELLHQWTLVNHFDLAGITCDDENQLLHVVEGNSMRVIAFGIPQLEDSKSYFARHGKNYLMEEQSFFIDWGTIQDTPLVAHGLEDLTWNFATQEFLLSTLCWFPPTRPAQWYRSPTHRTSAIFPV